MNGDHKINSDKSKFKARKFQKGFTMSLLNRAKLLKLIQSGNGFTMR